MFGVASFLTSRAGRRLAGVLGAAALLLVLTPTSEAATAPASDGVTIFRGTNTTPIFDSSLIDDCRPGITGTLVGTDVFSFQEVDRALGFEFDATDSATGQITWSDGSYTIVESVDHISFNLEPATREFTDAHKDLSNTYTAGGVFLFQVTFYVVEHFTRVDGVDQVSFERDHVHFFEQGFC